MINGGAFNKCKSLSLSLSLSLFLSLISSIRLDRYQSGIYKKCMWKYSSKNDVCRMHHTCTASGNVTHLPHFSSHCFTWDTDKKSLAGNNTPVNRTGQKPGLVSHGEKITRTVITLALRERVDRTRFRQSTEKVVCAIAAEKNEYRM